MTLKQADPNFAQLYYEGRWRALVDSANKLFGMSEAGFEALYHRCYYDKFQPSAKDSEDCQRIVRGANL